MKKWMAWICPGLAALAADWAVKAFLSDTEAVLIPGVIAVRPARNTGMAFSLLSGHPFLLGILSLAILAGAFLALRGRKLSGLARTALALMLGGALGNLADRLLTGYVPDMLEFLFVDFAVFNVADACLVTGCGLAALDLFREGKHG